MTLKAAQTAQTSSLLQRNTVKHLPQFGLVTNLVEAENETNRLLRLGRAYFAPTMCIVLHVLETNQIIKYVPAQYTMLGRNGEDIDLTSFNAQEMGVSRRHARLIRSAATLMIEDLGALNGTFLNSERLSGGQPNVICDGDEVRLGLLSFKVAFERKQP